MTNPTHIPISKATTLTRANLKGLPAVRAIVLSWRRLTGGGAPTLVACSGGADSNALALALWSAGAPITIGHVVHDLRPATEARADRDVARALAERLGVPFVESSIHVKGLGNDEGEARAGRYAALTEMAEGAGCSFIASAHHADDQLESMLMAIARGAGLEGLSGVAATRPLDGGLTLVRPMLSIIRSEAEAICEAGGAGWAHDLTNDDTDRFRSAVRDGPARLLLELRPGASLGAVRAGDLLRDTALLVRDRANEIFGRSDTWERGDLRSERAVVLGAGLRSASLRLTDGQGADSISRRVIDPVVRAIRDDSTEPRHFQWPNRITVSVTARLVTLTRTDGDPEDD